MSLGEVFEPDQLKFRNLMSMDTEGTIRAQPMDAVVLMGGLKPYRRNHGSRVGRCTRYSTRYGPDDDGTRR